MHHSHSQDQKCNNVTDPYGLPDFWPPNSLVIWDSESTGNIKDVNDLRRHVRVEVEQSVMGDGFDQWRRHLHACIRATESTTATLCLMAHRPALSRNCSEFRIIQLGLCSKHRGYPMSSRYFTSCIGCQSSSGSHISWQFWRTKFHSGLPQRLSNGTCLQQNFTFICHPAAGPTVHQDRLFHAYIPIFSTVCLELAATNCSHQRLVKL